MFTESKEHYDTVYIDLATRSIAAYCESREKVFCPDKDKQFTAKIKEYMHKTPFEWLKEIENTQYFGIEVINFREAIKLSYQKNNREIFIWIDNFYGLPVKVLEPSGKSWHFNYRDVNNLKDTDVMHA